MKIEAPSRTKAPPVAVVTPLAKEIVSSTATSPHLQKSPPSVTPLSTPTPLPRTAPCTPTVSHTTTYPIIPPSYHVVVLQRSSLTHPWGISLSMLEPSVVLLGDVMAGQSSHVQRLVASMALDPKRASELNPSGFWNRSNPVDIPSFTRLICCSSSRQPQSPGPSLLHSGDCLVGLNGCSMVQFPNLQHLTGVFRNSLQLQLLILRVPNALMRAQAVWTRVVHYPGTASDRELANPSYYAAAAAYSAVNDLRKTHRTMPPPTPYVRSGPAPLPQKPAVKNAGVVRRLPFVYTNPLFRDDKGSPLPYDDNDYEYNPEDDVRRAQRLFLSRIDSSNFSQWLQDRKAKWRKQYKVYPVEDIVDPESAERVYKSHVFTCSVQDRADVAHVVPLDFWSHQGYDSFHHWLQTSKSQWAQKYSWNERKRQRLEKDVEEVVHLEAVDGDCDFYEWLRVRKNQWRIQRRKRQRIREKRRQSELSGGLGSVSTNPGQEDATLPLETPQEKNTECEGMKSPLTSPTSVIRESFSASSVVGSSHVPSSELLVIDALLEKQEQERRAMADRPPLDISFMFDSDLGCPDDVVLHILRYLSPMEYGKLLCITKDFREGLQARDYVWRNLCKSHWKLPRRPRKPWHELYFKNLRMEKELSQKKWDELLSRASSLLLKGDHLQTLEKMVSDVETNFGFDINYTSGVMCERNSLLNLAVIHQRHKVVRWLVDAKNADIESCDRGNFTPLLNAAWAGDKYLVRFLLQKGSDRTVLGKCHYTKPLAAPDFVGLTAADWADKKGFHDIATLIRIGV